VFYLRHVTIVFLISMLIGVSVYSQNPTEIYAVEPFLIMHVSYCTYFMGLLIRPNPEFLTWEKEYYTFTVNALVGAGLHGYDIWYWFHGQDLMKPTPGPYNTLGFFIYFGQQQLFGWIRYVMRTWVCFLLCYLLSKLFMFTYIYELEKKIDREVPHPRLKTLIAQWDRELEARHGPVDKHLSPPPIYERRLSSISVHSAPLVSSSMSYQEQHVSGNSLAPPRSSRRKDSDEKGSSLGRLIVQPAYSS
jgi:hypothetical protein